MNQELRFIERVNEWIEEGHRPESDFSRTPVSRIQMEERFHCSSKVDRDPDFLAEFRELGRKRAREFLDAR